MTNTQYYQACVNQFMLAFKQPIYRFTSDVPDKVITFRGDLINEELEEYTDALQVNNKLEMLDGLCDLVYVIAGTLSTCGLLAQPYSATKGFVNEWSVEPYVSHIVDECYRPLPCHTDMYATCNRALKRIEDVGFRLRLREAFTVVHNNNMDKLWKTTSYDEDHISFPVSGRWLVKNKAGKVIKPATHTKPDLSPFIQ